MYKRLLRYRGKRNAGWLSVVSLLFLLVFTLQGCTSTAQKSPTPPPRLHFSPSPQPLASSARLDAYLQQLVANGRLSGSVLVAQHGRVFQHAYGFADSEAGIINTTQTNFRLGSVTKQFTAAAILLLQEREKLHVQIFAVIAILSIGFSRILEGSHWLTDVLGGYLCGLLLLYGLIFLYRLTTDKLAERHAKKHPLGSKIEKALH